MIGPCALSIRMFITGNIARKANAQGMASRCLDPQPGEYKAAGAALEVHRGYTRDHDRIV